jgi:hypothetical protein
MKTGVGMKTINFIALAAASGSGILMAKPALAESGSISTANIYQLAYLGMICSLILSLAFFGFAVFRAQQTDSSISCFPGMIKASVAALVVGAVLSIFIILQPLL